MFVWLKKCVQTTLGLIETNIIQWHTINSTWTSKLKGDGTLGSKSRARSGHTVRQREFETRFEKLPNVRTANVVGLFNFNHTEDLVDSMRNSSNKTCTKLKQHTWIERKRARCLAAISWYKLFTASALVSSRNSLYMLCVPERESYRIQMPKFLTLSGFFSWI